MKTYHIRIKTLIRTDVDDDQAAKMAADPDYEMECYNEWVQQLVHDGDFGIEEVESEESKEPVKNPKSGQKI